jgi:uncharacterized protein involved in type VI secretion and phage assembly
MSLALAQDRDTALESGGLVKGAAIGIVTQNAAKDARDKPHVALGKVKVAFTWASEQQSHWARVATPMAGKDRGLFCLPEVGDEVLCLFEREDAAHPYIIGALWNGKDKPPVANTDGKNDRRVLRSRKGHEIVFDDGDKGAVRIVLKSGSKERSVTLDDKGLRLDDGQGNTVEIDSTGPGAISITSAGRLSISAQTIEIKAKASLDIGASGLLNIKGATVQINCT